MKKSIYVLFTLLLSLFVFCGRVEADDNAIIWKKCNLEIEGHDGFVWFAVLMDGNNDKQSIKIFERTADGGKGKLEFFDNCWIKDYNDRKKVCKNVDHYDKAEIFNLVTKTDKCPTYIQNGTSVGGGWKGLAAGDQGYASEIVRVEPQYVVYSFDDLQLSCQTDAYDEICDKLGYYGNVLITEAYTSNGSYYDIISYVDTDGKVSSSNIAELFIWDRSYYQTQNIMMNGSDFFNVASGFKYQVISYSELGLFLYNQFGSYDKIETYMKNNHNYQVIFDSKNNIDKLYNAVDNVMSEKMIGQANDLTNSLNTLKTDYKKLSNACNQLNENIKNGNSYQFTNTYSVTNMVDDLNTALGLLLNISREKNTYKSCTTGKEVDFYSALFSCSINELIGLDKYSKDVVDHKYISDLIYKDIIEYVETSGKYIIDVSKAEEMIDSEVLNYLQCVSYLDSNYDKGGFVDVDGKNIELTDEYLNKIAELRGSYEEFSKSRNIYIVVDCKGLLGQELIKKIKVYVNIVKTAIPILLLIFGIIDFSKSTFSGSDDQMKKSWKIFTKRIGIAILIFFVPTLVEILLTIANEVWSFISPDSCGIF